MANETMPTLIPPERLAISGNGVPTQRASSWGRGEPTWEIAHLFPTQGNWTEEDYLSLEKICGDWIRVELSNGRLEVLPMPTEFHQDIVGFLLAFVSAFAGPRKLGKTSFSGLRIRVRNGENPEYREPDIAFMKTENAHRRHNEFWEGADLLMEVVSGDAKDRERDYVTKVREYAEAGISEYWIIDPDERRVRVLTLEGGAYKVHGALGPGAVATSVLLPGFSVAVDAILAAGNE